MREPPLGQRIHAVLVTQGRDAAVALAREAGQPDLFDRINAVAAEEPSPSFLHSALCAMSLPVRRPADDCAPIIRQDGQYTLAITPKPILRPVDGKQRLEVLGVPYGSLPRLILIHVMTEAVRTKSRQILLGTSFTDWMRRMGFRTVSYGPRGSATLIRQQLDRLLACEWMIRWDGEDARGTKEFGIKEIKLTSEYVGSDARNGAFMREIILTDGFFEHLRQHAVPLNENAIRQLRESATALDLYTWLAYRLPRISGKRPAVLSWQQLAAHFGNEGSNIRKFRQTVRDAWERQVSGVYPEARAEFDTAMIRLHASPAPLQRTLTPGFKLVAAPETAPKTTDADGTPVAAATPDTATGLMKALRSRLDPAMARMWLVDCSFAEVDGEWVLLAPTPFVANWLRQHFESELRGAGAEQRVNGVVTVAVRPR
ncbi:replication protein RepA [Plastoroseomonas hellenica]|uniref:replication protein RepA n=1 Tax=Plastoroseomonas hellenica TaxID=2687306 RepID=UPI001BA8D890|nr:replication protein RepA [Plastoroseomonas hellenica]MBR0641354.1 hypothetical protein [Plastoroseomonas hellenica]